MKELLLIFGVAALGSNLVFICGLGLRYFSPSERTPRGVFAEAVFLWLMIAAAALLSAGLDALTPAWWETACGKTAFLLFGSFLIYQAGARFFSLRRFEAGAVLLFAAALVAGFSGMSFFEQVSYGLGAGAGAAMAWGLMAGISERLDFSRVPKFLKTAPVFFIALGLLNLVFHYFEGLSKMCY